MKEVPLVSVMISTRNRAVDLRNTLRELRRQKYPSLELVVIDDASDSSLEQLVRDEWPGQLTFERSEVNIGMCQGRNRGFQLSQGKYIAQLDDDSHFTRDDDVLRAVQFLERRDEVGILAFSIFNGQHLPDVGIFSDAPIRYHLSFVGCAGMFRKSALMTVGGYLDFLQNEWEDNELSLRFIKANWAIVFFPSVLIHHHVSQSNRRTARTWMRGFRNKLWAVAMHMPAQRIPIEAGWILTVALWDSFRLIRPHRFVEGVVRFMAGLKNILAIRQSMDTLCQQRYDALRFRSLSTLEEWQCPPQCSLADVAHWFKATWLRRPRQRSFWDRAPGDRGSCETVKFSHEFTKGDSTDNTR